MRVLAVAVLVLALLAGCSDDEPAAKEDEPVQLKEVKAKADTGAITGAVVTETIVPIEGAVVHLQNQARNVTTGQDGTFVFDDLSPGFYVLNAAADGHFGVQSTVEVKAGEVAKVRMLLPIDTTPKPYFEPHYFKGHMSLSDWYGVYLLTTVIGNNELCECEYEFEMTKEDHTYVYEGVWVDNLGRPDHNLYWELEGRDEVGYAAAYSPSPIHAFVHESEYSGEGLLVSRISSDVGVDVDQDFEIFISVWRIGAPPTEDWSYIEGQE